MPKKKRLKLWEGRKRFQDVRRREVQQQMSSETDAGNIELEPEHHSELKPTSLPREDELSQKELNPYSVPHIDVKSLEEDFDFSHTTVKEEAEDEYDKMGFEDPLMGDMSEVKEELGSGYDGSFKSEEIYIKEEPMEPMQEPSNKEERRGEKRRGHFRSCSPDLQSNKQRLKVEEDVNVKDGPKYDKSGVLLDWPTTVEKKWKGIRSCYTRELLRKKNEKSGSVASGRKQYAYFETLHILATVSKRTARSMDRNSNQDNENEEVQEINQEMQKRRRNQSRKRKNEENDELIQVLKNKLLHESQEASVENDEDRLFLLSLASELHKVPAERKLKLRLDIIATIARAQQAYLQWPQHLQHQTLPTYHSSNPSLVTSLTP